VKHPMRKVMACYSTGILNRRGQRALVQLGCGHQLYIAWSRRPHVRARCEYCTNELGGRRRALKWARSYLWKLVDASWLADSGHYGPTDRALATEAFARLLGPRPPRQSGSGSRTSQTAAPEADPAA
jgi:hypothetical protein